MDHTNQSCLRIIGDVHGKKAEYLSLCDDTEYTLQVGDMAIRDYDWMHELDPEKHKFIGGNHDNYDVIEDSPHNLGNFGVWDVPDFGPIFYVRGGFSLDFRIRKSKEWMWGKTWWENEELTYAEANKALDLYKEVKPKILVSHECPINMVSWLTDSNFVKNFGFTDPIIKTTTNLMLQSMIEFHMPRIHLFGHFHKAFDKFCDSNGDAMPEDTEDETPYTRFICLPELGYIDLPENYVENL